MTGLGQPGLSAVQHASGCRRQQAARDTREHSGEFTTRGLSAAQGLAFSSRHRKVLILEYSNLLIMRSYGTRCRDCHRGTDSFGVHVMRYKSGYFSIVFTLSLLGAGACSSDGSGDFNVLEVQNDPPIVVDVDADGNTNFDLDRLRAELALVPLGTITAAEESGLVYMREEEKLAHDVYTVLNARWPHNTFANISLSELTHTEAVLLLLERYAITDPVGTNPSGVFQDPALQGLYDVLVARGSATLIDALMVGAEIEEIDLIDIEERLVDVSENDDIVLVYENLMKGSRNHLRAFVRALEQQNVTYQPQHLSQSVYDDIINSPTESGPT